MSNIIIAAFPDRRIFTEEWGSPTTDSFLHVSEFFCDTIQGEGVYIGQPATFLRLQGCHIKCSFCDTTAVWTTGNPYTFEELFLLMDTFQVPRKLKYGQHLVITGGSPLLQQAALINFIKLFITKYGFKPFIEVENEATINPKLELTQLIDCWNNSPKLENSNVIPARRYKRDILVHMGYLKHSWFKFVISDESDWLEIELWFIQPAIIRKDQIILMPEGATREEINAHQDTAINLAIKHGVRYSDRLHIHLWDKTIGV